MYHSLWPHGLQHAKLPCPSPSSGACWNSGSLSQWCPPTISSCRLLLLPFIFLSTRLFSNESALPIRWTKYWSFSFSISPFNEYLGLIWSPCSPRDTQKSSPTPQFKGSNSSVLRFLYSPTITLYMTNRKTIALTRWTLLAKYVFAF